MFFKPVILFIIILSVPQKVSGNYSCASSIGKTTKINVKRADPPCSIAEKISENDELFCAEVSLETSSDGSTSTSTFGATCLGSVAKPSDNYISCNGFNGTWATITFMMSENTAYAATMMVKSDDKISAVTDRGSCSKSE